MGQAVGGASAAAIAAPVAPARTGPAVSIRGRRYPVLLPKLRDPRLHVASVIVSVQVLGQVVLGFDVSVAQILLSIGTAAVLELGIVAVTQGVIAWPASALLTGNGVALLLRTPGTEHGDWWSTQGWQIFVAAAGISLLSKYAIRVGDRHVFNPSNLGLVIVFLLFGPAHADPQDLWWGPWRAGLVLTVAIIVVGGITLSIRLKLFSVAATFWLTFAAGIAVLAAQGHAITARWHVGPLEGWDYWWVYAFSPEIVIFVFFMITDPRTAPLGRVARPVYAAAVGVLAAVFAALQTTEFATKVSLLVALTLVCAARPLLERRLADDRVAAMPTRWWSTTGSAGHLALRPTRAGVGALAVIVLLSLGTVALLGARTDLPSAPGLAAVAAGAAGERPAVDLPEGAVPTVTVDPALADLPGTVSADDAQRIGRDLVEGLAIEADAVFQQDPALAATALFGRRLAEVEEQIAASTDEPTMVSHHEFDELRVVLLRDPVSPQALPQLGVLASGEVTELWFDDLDAEVVAQQATVPVERIYLVTLLGEHHLIGDVLPVDSPMLVAG